MRDYPDGGNRRWFWRLEDQHRRLLQPDLRLIAAVATRLAEETPALAGPVAAAMKELVLKEPDLRPLLQRLQRCDPGGAQNVSRPASGGPLQSQRPHRLTAAQA